MYEKILVAIDGSDVGNGAFEHALQLAKSEQAEVFALYVIEFPKFYIPEVGYDPTPIYEALRTEAEFIAKQAGDLLKQEGVGGKADYIDNFYTGVATAEQIQRTADEFQANLVVLGTHGRSGFKRLVLGSVAEAFARTSTRPVLLVPEKAAVVTSTTI